MDTLGSYATAAGLGCQWQLTVDGNVLGNAYAIYSSASLGWRMYPMKLVWYVNKVHSQMVIRGIVGIVIMAVIKVIIVIRAIIAFKESGHTFRMKLPSKYMVNSELSSDRAFSTNNAVNSLVKPRKVP